MPAPRPPEAVQAPTTQRGSESSTHDAPEEGARSVTFFRNDSESNACRGDAVLPVSWRVFHRGLPRAGFVPNPARHLDLRDFARAAWSQPREIIRRFCAGVELESTSGKGSDPQTERDRAGAQGEEPTDHHRVLTTNQGTKQWD